MKKRFAAWMLSLVMCLSVFSAGTAGAVYMADMNGHWAKDVAELMVEINVMEVDHNGYFHPNAYTTRGDFVVYLWRIFGEQDIEVYGQTFSDVSRYSPYFTAVEWCAFMGVTNGVGGGRFDLNGTLTREMAFTFLYRTMVFMDVAPVYGDGHEMMKQITEFKDYLQVSDWAADSVQLLLDVGIVRGTGDKLEPKGKLQNSHTAALLCQYMEYVAEML